MNEINSVQIKISNSLNGLTKIEPLISKYCFGVKNSPLPLLEEYRISFQQVIGDKLQVIVFLPGVRKKSLIIRVNEDTLAISAEYLKEIKTLLNPCRPLELRVSLIEPINVNSVQAVYKNGVLFVEFEIIKKETDKKYQK